MRKPFAIDLYCGLGGWTEGLLAEGWDVIGFDIERHEYGDEKYPAQLVLQNVLTIHGSQFKDASLIVASSPCQKYSYMAMPWTRAKDLARWYKDPAYPERLIELNALFEAPARIQREACEAAGRYIPMVQENVKGAQPWVGRSRWNFGSFHLWGDVPALMPMVKRGAMKHGITHRGDGSTNFHGVKVPGMNWSGSDKPGYVAKAFNGTAEQQMRDDIKNNGGSWFAIGAPGQKEVGRNPVTEGSKGIPHRPGGHWTNSAEHGHRCNCTRVCDCQCPEPEEGAALVSEECPIHNLYPESNPDCPVHSEVEGRKQQGSGAAWFDRGIASLPSGSKARKAASAKIAKIPLPLSQHIARVYYPRNIDKEQHNG